MCEDCYRRQCWRRACIFGASAIAFLPSSSVGLPSSLSTWQVGRAVKKLEKQVNLQSVCIYHTACRNVNQYKKCLTFGLCARRSRILQGGCWEGGASQAANLELGGGKFYLKRERERTGLSQRKRCLGAQGEASACGDSGEVRGGHLGWLQRPKQPVHLERPSCQSG